MLEHEELVAVADLFGVSEEQVRRDHLISHVLAGLQQIVPDVLFVGGTALARTHLSDPAAGGRLSEDIDLWTPDRAAVATALDEQLPRSLRREFPGPAGIRHCDPRGPRSSRAFSSRRPISASGSS